jgi:MarR family transcriptional regulator, organic hydroperoxide resistance regulator
VSAKLNLDDYLPYLVNRVGNIIADHYAREVLAKHRLSIAEWRVIAALASKGSQRQIDLAELTSIDSSTLSRLVTRLVKMGLLSRTRSPTSPREVTVKLTTKGNRQAERLIPLARRYEAVAATGLRADEIAALKTGLRRMYANMKEREAAKTSAS